MDIYKIIRLRPGRYVIAVSGGVDSMVLLDLLARRAAIGRGRNRRGNAAIGKNAEADGTNELRHYSPGTYHFTVAHFDHGIREDSHVDRQLIKAIADRHGLPFVYDKAALGPDASEAAARHARYEFLEKVRTQAGADAILTAHHLDDVTETAIHNILRGTGRKGMSSLGNRAGIVRPLSHLPKSKLQGYAQANGLKWREDNTNAQTKYRRNYIRHQLIPTLQERSPKEYERLVRLIKRQAELNQAIDQQLTHLLHQQPEAGGLDRHGFIMLPHDVSQEIMAHWLRQNGHGQFTRKRLNQLVTRLKTGRPGSFHDVDAGNQLVITKKSINLHSKV
jgi:tRNA(Ile)-lysidine synthase